MRRKIMSLSFALAAITSVASAQSNGNTQSAANAPPADELQRANAAFTASNWSDANAQYASLTRRFPNHPLAKFRTGVTLTELGKPAEAESFLREGERLGIPVPQAAYRLSEALAEQKKSDAAIAELLRSARAGFYIPPTVLDGNTHLASLKTNAQWPAVLDAFDVAVHPCMHSPKFREFDFWVGDWNVQPRNGPPPSGTPSRNRITLEESGCVVQEHYVSGPYTGQSFNIYDMSMGKWRQTWIDNTGGQHDYVGSLVNGNMVFEGTTPAPAGRLGRIPTRLTLFHISKDSVRQFSETSPDSGRTWVTSYDLIYTRRAP